MNDTPVGRPATGNVAASMVYMKAGQPDRTRLAQRTTRYGPIRGNA